MGLEHRIAGRTARAANPEIRRIAYDSGLSAEQRRDMLMELETKSEEDELEVASYMEMVLMEIKSKDFEE